MRGYSQGNHRCGRMRQTVLLMLCLLAVLLLPGCATSDAIADGKGFGGVMEAVKIDLFGSQAQDCLTLSVELPFRQGFSPIKDQSAYASLKDVTMQEVYKNLEQNIYQISHEKTADGLYEVRYTRLPSELTFDQIYIIKEAVISDHPEAFWLRNDYDVRNNFHDGSYLVMYAKYSYDETLTAFEEVNAATEMILSAIPDDADELQREMIIHDALVDGVEYDFEAAETDDANASAFDVYGALVRRKAVCSGYANAMKMLLNRVGVECRLVVGMSKNSGHMWNQVKINDNWYQLDVTWDDAVTESEVRYSKYCYFNLNDELMALNHKTGKSFREMSFEQTNDNAYVTAELYNFDLEECRSLDLNYYAMNAVQVNALDNGSMRAVANKMAQAAQKKEELFYIQFGSTLSGDDAEAWLIKKSGQKYSVLEQSLVDTNSSGKGTKVKRCSLVRLATKEEDIWTHVYAVRLIYD